MNTIAQLIFEQDGKFTLQPDQQLRLHQRNGSSTTFGSPNKSWDSWRTSSWTEQQVFIFLVQVVISLAGNLLSWQSTGGVGRYTCRTPHFLMHRRCTASAYRHHAHSWLKSSRVVPHKTFTLHLCAPCPMLLTHFTPKHLHSVLSCSGSSIFNPLRRSTTSSSGASAELPAPTSQRCWIVKSLSAYVALSPTGTCAAPAPVIEFVASSLAAAHAAPYSSESTRGAHTCRLRLRRISRGMNKEQLTVAAAASMTAALA